MGYAACASGPNLPMALDEQRNLLYVTALGERPVNTGGLFRIDTTRAQLHDTRIARASRASASSARRGRRCT